jgi:hypothetical protein
MKSIAFKSAVAFACGIFVLGFAGCAKMSEPFKDAPRGETNNSPADTLTFPDGFSNASTKCDHGNRVYVLYHGDSTYGSIAVVPNAEDC